MIKIENFNEWEPQKEIVGSGKGKKVWLVNPKNPNQQGWFKYVKKTIREGKEVNSYENFSEKLAELIANNIEIKNAHIDIGIYQGELGCLSYDINEQMEEIVSLITKKYPKYNEKNLYDEQNKIYYSINMILNSLDNKNLEKDFFKILKYVIEYSSIKQYIIIYSKNILQDLKIQSYIDNISDNKVIKIELCSEESKICKNDNITFVKELFYQISGSELYNLIKLKNEDIKDREIENFFISSLNFKGVDNMKNNKIVRLNKICNERLKILNLKDFET